MYSKVYWISCDANKVEKLKAHYDSVMTPAIKGSEHHESHQMIETEKNKWLLISNYKNRMGADASGPLVQSLIKPMSEQFGMTIDIIAQGDVVKSI